MKAGYENGLLILLVITCTFGFNIDTKIPFVRRGDGKSYFGFSLAEHQITDSFNTVIENVLLVGAPRYVKNGNQIGGLFKCNFTAWCESTCDYQPQVEADDITTITGTRADQWFGSVVRSSGKGGFVVVCAHRFSTASNVLGKCIALKQSLTFFRNVMPCEEDPLEQQGTSFCQAGTAADINSDGNVILGGPGAGIWTGGVFTFRLKKTLGAALIYFSSSWKEEPGLKIPPIEYNSYMVPECKSDARKKGNYGFMKDVRFFPYPTKVKNARLRSKWLQLIRRPVDYNPTRHHRVCSLHFVDACPTDEHPFPTLFQWNNFGKPDEKRDTSSIRKRESLSRDTETYMEVSDDDCRDGEIDISILEATCCDFLVESTVTCTTEPWVEDTDESVLDNSIDLTKTDHTYMYGEYEVPLTKDSCTQTDLTMDMIAEKEHDLQQLDDRQALLRNMIVEKVTESDKTVKEYTGFPSKQILNGVFGYAVTSGHYDSTDPDQMFYVGGAPHANETGVVVLFYQQKGGYLNYRDNMIINGIEPFSLFGFDLATVDLNNDGFDDLIVGAPMFYVRAKAGGALYIYMGSADGIVSSTKPTRITSLKETENECKKFTCTESRFGSSVAPAGDINLDGYQDLVVGAPYEGDGRGAVYLFHGSKDGVVEKYAQRIHAADIDTSDTIRTFGYSVGGQLDLDQNGYDDISVGAYQSDKAFLLRTRPIVRLSANLTVSPMRFNLSQPKTCDIPHDSAKKHCIDLYLCVSFSAKEDNSLTTKQKIFYKIELEKGVQFKRATFINIDPLHPDGTIKEDWVDLPRPYFDVCKKEKIKLKDQFNDRLSPISFTVAYSLAELDFPSPNQCSDGVPDINKYPVLVSGKDKETTIVSEMIFAKECGSNDICESDISMQTSILNQTSLKKAWDGTVLLSYGKDIQLIVDIKLNNTGEPAYATKLFITVPKYLDMNKVETIFSPFDESSFSIINTTSVVIEGIGNPFGNREKSTNCRHYHVYFDLHQPPGVERSSIIVKVNTTSEEQNTVGDVQEIKVGFINKAEVEVQGGAEPDGDVFFRISAKGFSVVKKESDIGPAINHIYRVINHGPGTVGGATLRIYWPFELKTELNQRQPLLYLMQDPVVISGSAECLSYPDLVNPLGIEPTNDILADNAVVGPSYTTNDKSRKTRKSDLYTTLLHAQTQPRKEDHSINSIVKIDCYEAKCRVMECRIKGLKKDHQVKILLRARLWESTLVKEFNNSAEVWIHSEGMVILDSDLHLEQNVTNDRYRATTYTLPGIGLRVTEEIEWQTLIEASSIGVLFGVFILVNIISICWKCGFFKRLRPNDNQPKCEGDVNG